MRRIDRVIHKKAEDEGVTAKFLEHPHHIKSFTCCSDDDDDDEERNDSPPLSR